ncbi:hypothetical protein [Sinorhizobium sp. A49]|nr:hypothetical protein [Sinorhizobium sp. A49]
MLSRRFCFGLTYPLTVSTGLMRATGATSPVATIGSTTWSIGR